MLDYKLLHINLQNFNDGEEDDNKVFSATIGLDFTEAINSAMSFKEKIKQLNTQARNLSDLFAKSDQSFSKSLSAKVLQQYQDAIGDLKTFGINVAEGDKIGDVLRKKLSSALLKHLTSRQINLIPADKELNIEFDLKKEHINTINEKIVGGVINSLKLPPNSESFMISAENIKSIKSELEKFVAQSVQKGINFKDVDGKPLQVRKFSINEEATDKLFKDLEIQLVNALKEKVQFDFDPNKKIDGVGTINDVFEKITANLNGFEKHVNGIFEGTGKLLKDSSEIFSKDTKGIEELKNLETSYDDFIKALKEKVTGFSRLVFNKVMDSLNKFTQDSEIDSNYIEEIKKFRANMVTDIKKLIPDLDGEAITRFSDTGKSDEIKNLLNQKIKNTQDFIDQKLMSSMSFPDQKASTIKDLAYSGDKTVEQLLNQKRQELESLKNTSLGLGSALGENVQFNMGDVLKNLQNSIKSYVDKFYESARGTFESGQFENETENLKKISQGLLGFYENIVKMYSSILDETIKIDEAVKVLPEKSVAILTSFQNINESLSLVNEKFREINVSSISESLIILKDNFEKIVSDLKQAQVSKEQGLDKSVPEFKQVIEDLGKNFSELVGVLKSIDVTQDFSNAKKEIEELSKNLIKVVGKNTVSQLDKILQDQTAPQELAGAGDLKEKINEKISKKLTSLAPKLLQKINSVFDGIKIPDLDVEKSFNINVESLKKKTQERLSKMMGFSTTDELVKANPIIKGFEIVKLLGEERLKLLNQTFYNTFDEKMAKTTGHTIRELKNLSKGKPDDSVMTNLQYHFDRLQDVIIRKVRDMIEEQFNVLIKDIRKMKIIPASIGNVQADRRMPIIPSSSRRRSASNLELLPIDDMFKPAAPVVSDIPGVSKGVINPNSNRYDTSTQNFSGAIRNTLRYILSNRLFTMPMQAFESAKTTTIDLDYRLEKARQNLVAKYSSGEVPFRSIAETQIDNKLKNDEYRSIILKELKLTEEQFKVQDMREKLIKKEVRLLERQSREGAKNYLQDLSLMYGVDLTQMASMWQIATRTYDNPFEAQKLVRSSARLYSSSPEDITPEEAAKGMESIKSQWGLTVDELEKYSNIIMKTELSSQATVKDIIAAQQGTGSVFRNFLSDKKYSKEEQFAISNALISLFIGATGKSGSEAATMFKTSFASPFTGDQTKFLQQAAENTGITRLSPYKFDELKPGSYTPTSERKSGDEMFLDILGTFKELSQSYPDIADNLISKIFQRRYTSDAIAIASLLEKLPEGKDGETAFDSLVKRLMDDKGINDYLWQQQTTMSSKTQKAKTAWQVVGSEFGEAFKPEFSALVDALTGLAIFVRDNSAILKELTKVAVNLGFTIGAIKLYENKFKGKFTSALMNAELMNKANPLTQANKVALLAREDALGQMDLKQSEINKIVNERNLNIDVADYLGALGKKDDLEFNLQTEKNAYDKLLDQKNRQDLIRENVEMQMMDLETKPDAEIANELKKKYKTFDKMPKEKQQELIEERREDNNKKLEKLKTTLNELDEDGISDEIMQEQNLRFQTANKDLIENQLKLGAYDKAMGPYESQISSLAEEYSRASKVAQNRDEEISENTEKLNLFNKAYQELGANKLISPFGETTKLKTETETAQGSGTQQLQIPMNKNIPLNAVEGRDNVLAQRVLGTKIVPKGVNEYLEEKNEGISFNNLDEYKEKTKEKEKLNKQLNYMEASGEYLNEILNDTDKLEKSGLTFDELSMKIDELSNSKIELSDKIEVVNQELEEMEENLEKLNIGIQDFDLEDYKKNLKDPVINVEKDLFDAYKLDTVSSEGFIGQYNKISEKSSNKIVQAINVLTATFTGQRLAGRILNANAISPVITRGGLSTGATALASLFKPLLAKIPQVALLYAAGSVIQDVGSSMFMSSSARAMNKLQNFETDILKSENLESWANEGGAWRKPAVDLVNIARVAKGTLGYAPSSTKSNSKDIINSMGGDNPLQLDSAIKFSVAGSKAGKIGAAAGFLLGLGVDAIFRKRGDKEIDPWDIFFEQRPGALKEQSEFEMEQLERNQRDYIKVEDGSIPRQLKSFDADLELINNTLERFEKELQRYQAETTREFEARLFKESFKSRSTSESSREIMEEIYIRNKNKYEDELALIQDQMEGFLNRFDNEILKESFKTSDAYQSFQRNVETYQSLIQQAETNLKNLFEISIQDIERDVALNSSRIQTQLTTEKSHLILKGFTENNNEIIDLNLSSLDQNIKQIYTQLKREEEEFYTDDPVKKIQIQEIQENIKDLQIVIEDLLSSGVNGASKQIRDIANEINKYNLEIKEINGLQVDQIEAHTEKTQQQLRDLRTLEMDRLNTVFQRFNAYESNASLDMGMAQSRTAISLSELYKKGFGEETVAYRKLQESMMKENNATLNQLVNDSRKEIQRLINDEGLQPDSLRVKGEQAKILGYNAQIAENTRAMYDLWRNSGSFGLPEGIREMTSYEYEARKNTENSKLIQQGNVTMQVSFGDVYANDKAQVNDLINKMGNMLRQVNGAVGLNQQFNGIRGVI